MLKKNILLLTSIYPAPDLMYGTPSIHYFTKEWVQMGYQVKVIHFQAVYPTFFYLLAKLFREQIASRTGAIVFTNRDKEDKNYIIDGVTVNRYPIFKLIPHGRYSKTIISKQIEKIVQSNTIDNFSPDIIIGHFSNPQLEIVSALKKCYSALTCMVMHDVGDTIKQIYRQNYQEIIDCIDIWGYRSLPIQKGFENNFGKKEHSFLCYSGIPEKYISQSKDKSFSGKLKEFIYVGEFIKRKFPVSIVRAINEIYSNEEVYKINYVGRGAEEGNIKKEVVNFNIKEHVAFSGFLPRNDVQQLLDKAECFIMISKGEAFGLVYLEAMGRGCITIGSKNEGIDGVIKHGINGFLCEAGNEKELAQIIREINQLTPAERKRISVNAIATAEELTDYKAALKYINAINY